MHIRIDAACRDVIENLEVCPCLLQRRTVPDLDHQEVQANGCEPGQMGIGNDVVHGQ